MTESVPEFVIAIPARYASTRLPGKPLCLLDGRPMILHVAERAVAAGAVEVVVATDDSRVAEAVEQADVDVSVRMTGDAHATGSDRVAECAGACDWPDDTLVVNLQGDEPFAPTEGIRAVASALAADTTPMATLATPIQTADELFLPEVVKVVTTQAGRALYFTRAPAPWARDAFAEDPVRLPENSPCRRHIGIYAYRAGFLRRFATMSPSPLEEVEALEQLRALEHGHAIAVRDSPVRFPPGIDTPADVARAQAWLDTGVVGG